VRRYEIKKYERDPKTSLAPPSLREVHPLGQVTGGTDDGLRTPVRRDLEYLVEKYGAGKLAPKRDTPSSKVPLLHALRGRLADAVLAAAADLQPRAQRRRSWCARSRRRSRARSTARSFAPTSSATSAFLDGELAKSPWFAGEFSAAESRWSIRWKRSRRACRTRPRGSRIGSTALHARDAYKRALDKGGPWSIDP